MPTVMVRLDSTDDNVPTRTTKSELFGELVKRTDGRMTAYRSDLFHDAFILDSWLDRPLTDDLVFYYGIRDTGTDMYSLPRGDADVVAAMLARNGWNYRVTLKREGSWFVAYFTGLHGTADPCDCLASLADVPHALGCRAR